MTDQLYAYYSKTQAERARFYCLYRSVEDGREIMVSEVSEKEFTPAEIKRLDDRTFVGMVDKFLSRHDLVEN